MKINLIAALLTLTCFPLVAQNADTFTKAGLSGWVPGHQVERWAPITTTQGHFTTVINTSTACPVQLLEEKLGTKGDGGQNFVVGGAAPGGGLIVGGPYPTYSPSMKIKVRNDSSKRVTMVSIADSSGNETTYLWPKYILPGQTKKQATQPNEQVEKGMAVWISSVVYADNSQWVDPNFGHIQPNGTGATCYYRQYDNRPWNER